MKSKYLVYLSTTSAVVQIHLDGYGLPTGQGFNEIGDFTLDIDENNKQVGRPSDLNQDGEHILVAKAKEILADHLEMDPNSARLRQYVFFDKSSNTVPAASYDEDGAQSMDMDSMQKIDPNDSPDATDQAARERGAGEPTPGEAQATGETIGDGEEKKEAESATDLKTRIAGITDKEELQKLYDEESSGKKRTTVLKAIEDRAAELDK